MDPTTQKVADIFDVPPVLLITEDNDDLRFYIKQCLGSDYIFIEAKNGDEGFKKAIKVIPDLIISDLMMPIINGLQFCKQLKTDERTNHIPFMLVTATVSNEIKVEGLRIGVDDFLDKPFDSNTLRLKVKNSILQRNRLQLKLKTNLNLESSNKKVQSKKEMFINKLRYIIESNINKNELSVSFLSKKLGMSRVQVYRKTHGLTGLSASEFIRMVRLQKASFLFQQQHGTVSEIAYLVGFNNLSYFTKCFKGMFGQTPSEYMATTQYSDETDL